MTDIVMPLPRLGAYPGSLYQAEHLAGFASRRAREGFYGQMLSDDLRNHRYAYEISFVSAGLDSLKASELMFALLNDFNHSGYDRDPANLVCDFACTLLQESSDGNAMLLELHSLPSSQNRAKRRARRKEAADEADEKLPSLGLIPNWSAKKTRGGFSQMSPLGRQHTISIPRKRVHRLELTRQNRSRWTQAVKGLRLVDSTKLTSAGVNRLSWEGYSFSEAVTAQNLAVATSTAKLGWDGRGTLADMATSPYMTFRRLRFTKFWIEALQESTAFLNQFTTSDLLYGKDRFSFSLTGLPSATELTQAMTSIRNGTLTVGEAHNSYLFPKYSKQRSSSSPTG